MRGTMTSTMRQGPTGRFGRRAEARPGAGYPFAGGPRGERGDYRRHHAEHGRHAEHGHYGGHDDQGSHGRHHAKGERPSGAQDHGRRGGRDGGHEGRGGRGRRGGGPRVGKGDVRAATLLLLAEGPLHGYQIIHLIEERSGGLWRPSAGSVYPALQLLEDEGLVQAEQVEGRRVYHLTEVGRAHVEGRRVELTAARDAVTAAAGEGWAELRALLGQMDAALRQVAQVGTPGQQAAAGALLADTRRQLYRILAEDTDDDANNAAPSDIDAVRP